jgi:hypothetical protein
VFRDNATKEWWWGVSVDVDGDLACLVFLTGSSMFRRNGSKWTEFHSFPTSFECILSDATIAVFGEKNNDYQIQLYEFNEGQDAVLPIQDPIILEDFAHNLALSNDYLAYSQVDSVFVYQRNSGNQTYIFHQKLAIANGISEDLIVTH